MARALLVFFILPFFPFLLVCTASWIELKGFHVGATDGEILTLTGPLFDGAYEFFRRQLLLGREPA